MQREINDFIYYMKMYQYVAFQTLLLPFLISHIFCFLIFLRLFYQIRLRRELYRDMKDFYRKALQDALQSVERSAFETIFRDFYRKFFPQYSMGTERKPITNNVQSDKTIYPFP